MENDSLNKIWEVQTNDISNFDPRRIIAKANKQRNGQYVGIAVMSLTAVILIVYAINYAFHEWNAFNTGLLLMISSLTFRIILEFYTVYRKEKHLISLDHKAYNAYLKEYFKIRLIINYIVTPVCLLVYIVGFYLLLPYFKEAFSNGFYIYIVISGVVSILAIIAIVVYSTIKEKRFLKELNQ